VVGLPPLIEAVVLHPKRLESEFLKVEQRDAYYGIDLLLLQSCVIRLIHRLLL
jgi:hypothetical protein